MWTMSGGLRLPVLLFVALVISSTAFIPLSPLPAISTTVVMMSARLRPEKPVTRWEVCQRSAALGSGMLAGALLEPDMGSAAEEREKDEVEQFSELRGALEREEKMEQVASSCIVEVPIGHHTSGSPCITVPCPYDSCSCSCFPSVQQSQNRNGVIFLSQAPPTTTWCRGVFTHMHTNRVNPRPCLTTERKAEVVQQWYSTAVKEGASVFRLRLYLALDRCWACWMGICDLLVTPRPL